MNNVRVTIAIPFFNDERYLPFSIQSVINQTYKNWELLLIDDGSSDNSYKIAYEFAKNDSRIKLLKDDRNQGLAERLNQSINMAKGTYYARMDADDIMAVNRIERQVDFLIKHSDIDVVGSSAMIIDENNQITRSSSMDGVVTGFIHPTVFGRTAWFKKYMYNPSCKRSQDVELWLRSGGESNFYNIVAPLLFYREFGVQSLDKNLASHKAYRNIARNYKQYGKPMSWCFKQVLMSYFRDIVYIIFASIGRLDFLVHSRQRKQLAMEFCLTQDDLDASIKKEILL